MAQNTTSRRNPLNTTFDPSKLASFIEEAGLSYRTTSKSFVFDCPLCQSKDRLYIRKSDGRFICWKCATNKKFQGAPEFALEALTGTPLKRIREALYGTSHYQAALALDITLKAFQDEEDAPEEGLEGYQDFQGLTWPYHCLPLDRYASENGVKYLEDRGISLGVALRYDIRYSPERRSIAFPMWVGNRLVGWQYRTIDPTLVTKEDGTPVELLKTVSSLDIPRDRCLMFSNRLTSDFAVLCEGPVDALKADLLGSGNVASMGKKISQKQIELLLRSGIKKLYIALDPDAAEEINPLLKRIGDVEAYLVELPCKDPKKKVDLGSLSMEEARDCVLAAKPIFSNRIHVWLDA